MPTPKPLPRLLLWLPLLLGAALALLYWRGLTFDVNRSPARLLGKPLPSFQLPALATPDVSLHSSAIKGPALVNFWATWCAACRAEHAQLLALARQQAIALYSINYQDDAVSAKAWLQQQGDPFVWTMFDGAAALSGPLDILGLPETYLIDANGVVRYRHVGELTEPVWQAMRQALAAENAAFAASAGQK
jgi:cytochrome c biogenesis protein CcmG/thiol:disulfide interchange protein DsbE